MNGFYTVQDTFFKENKLYFANTDLPEDYYSSKQTSNELEPGYKIERAIRFLIRMYLPIGIFFKNYSSMIYCLIYKLIKYPSDRILYNKPKIGMVDLLISKIFTQLALSIY